MRKCRCGDDLSLHGLDLSCQCCPCRRFIALTEDEYEILCNTLAHLQERLYQQQERERTKLDRAQRGERVRLRKQKEQRAVEALRSRVLTSQTSWLPLTPEPYPTWTDIEAGRQQVSLWSVIVDEIKAHPRMLAELIRREMGGKTPAEVEDGMEFDTVH